MVDKEKLWWEIIVTGLTMITFFILVDFLTSGFLTWSLWLIVIFGTWSVLFPIFQHYYGKNKVVFEGITSLLVALMIAGFGLILLNFWFFVPVIFIASGGIILMLRGLIKEEVISLKW